MKKLLLPFFLIPCLSYANNLSEQAAIDIADFADLDEEDISLENHILIIQSDRKTIQRKYAIHLMTGICEFVALEPDDWKNTHFEAIEIRNRLDNQGYHNKISDRDCRFMINKDLSDSEINYRYFNTERLKSFKGKLK